MSYISIMVQRSRIYFSIFNYFTKIRKRETCIQNVSSVIDSWVASEESVTSSSASVLSTTSTLATVMFVTAMVFLTTMVFVTTVMCVSVG